MDPLQAFEAEVTDLVSVALADVGEAPTLEQPPDPSMGQLALPCFPLAKALRRAPVQIAAELAAGMDVSGYEWLAGAEAAGPYVNFRLDAKRLASWVLAAGADAWLAEPQPRAVLLEHTSANPNGPLHVGRARNPILGDTLARLLRAGGHQVNAQYYLDNLGRQVALLYWGKKNIKPEDLPPAGRDKADHDLVRYYQAASDAMKADPEVAAEIKKLVATLETADEALLAEVREVYLACFGGMLESLDRLGVKYDSIKDESDLVNSGAVDDVVAELKASPRAGQEDDGANYLDLSDILKGQKSKFFFTRSDGTSVYATRDVAYHAWKAREIGDGILLNVLGEDHRLQSLQVETALTALGLRSPDVVFYSFVRLAEGKMSTRLNRVVFLDDLLDEAIAIALEEVKKRRSDELDEATMEAIAQSIGIGAVRFNIARIQPEKPIAFRWEEALNFEGDSAPYIMYAHARAASLAGRAAEAGITVSSTEGLPIGPGEERLLGIVAQFQHEVREAIANHAPHRFAAYACALASAFNEYYRDHHVVHCEDPALQAVRLATVNAAKGALAAAHDALGLPVLTTM